MTDSDYESVLLVKREVFVYTLPPRQSARGYRAADWSLDAPAWTGRLRVVSRENNGSDGASLFIKLEEATSGRLYAQCPVESFPGMAMEQVLDSSRYFVVRLVSDDGRSAFVGIGFAERSDAFDLNVTIQDYFKHLKQAAEAEKLQAEYGIGGANGSSLPKMDLGLKEGQRLHLNLNTRRAGDSSEGGTTRTRPLPSLKLGTPTGMPGLLPPPPSARSRQNQRGTASPSPQTTTTAASTLPTEGGGRGQATSNVDLLADIFAAPPASTTAPPQHDFSLL